MPDSSASQQLRQMVDLITPMCLRVAATLRIPDYVMAGAATVPALADRCGAQPDALRRLLRHLVTIGVLVEAAGGEYGLTELGRELQGDAPDGLRAAIDINGSAGRADLASMRLLDTVLTGHPAYPLVYSRTFWEDLAADRDLRTSFDQLMAAHDPSPAVAGYPWDTLAEVVDVGGGNGTLLAALLAASPNLRGTLVELDGAAQDARRLFAERGLADRARVAVGSFFDPLPPGASAYVLSNLIHDWSDADAIRILSRCAEAAGATGKVLVVQGLLDDAGRAEATLSDLTMLIYMGGRERTLAELAGLGASAGLALTATKCLGRRYLLEFTPTSG